MSATGTTLAGALAAFQATLPTIGKDNTAKVKSDKGNYEYKYADLADVSSAVLPALATQNLAWTTLPTLDDEGRFVLRYELMHGPSGERIGGSYPLPAPGGAQAMGSAITYARRYTLCSVTGVAPDADDDGAAVGTQPTYSAPKARPAPPTSEPPPVGGVTALRVDIAKAARAVDPPMDIETINADFHEWSRGKAVGEADEATLREYLVHLYKRKAGHG